MRISDFSCQRIKCSELLCTQNAQEVKAVGRDVCCDQMRTAEYWPSNVLLSECK